MKRRRRGLSAERAICLSYEDVVMTTSSRHETTSPTGAHTLRHMVKCHVSMTNAESSERRREAGSQRSFWLKGGRCKLGARRTAASWAGRNCHSFQRSLCVRPPPRPTGGTFCEGARSRSLPLTGGVVRCVGRPSRDRLREWNRRGWSAPPNQRSLYMIWARPTWRRGLVAIFKIHAARARRPQRGLRVVQSRRGE